MKAEVESTIKTGRKVCEDKFTKDPKQLSQRIDALKHLYNSLGESVTQTKRTLEHLLHLSKLLNGTFESVEENLRQLQGEENFGRNSLFLEIDEGVHKLEDIYKEYCQTCESVYVEDVRAKIDSIRARYFQLSSVDVIKRLAEMKSTLQNLDNISLETLRKMESELEKIYVSDPEMDNLHTEVIHIVKVRCLLWISGNLFPLMLSMFWSLCVVSWCLIFMKIYFQILKNSILQTIFIRISINVIIFSSEIF